MPHVISDVMRTAIKRLKADVERAALTASQCRSDAIRAEHLGKPAEADYWLKQADIFESRRAKYAAELKAAQEKHSREREELKGWT